MRESTTSTVLKGCIKPVLYQPGALASICQPCGGACKQLVWPQALRQLAWTFKLAAFLSIRPI